MADQGAGRNSGQGAGKSFVQFSRGAAQRIAKVVRTVEAGDRSQPGIEFDHPMPGAVAAKVATFTGTWATGTYKTVTLTNSTNTVSVINWTTPVVAMPDNSSCARHVVFTKASGSNVAVEIEMQGTCFTCVHTLDGVDLTTLTGYTADKAQLLAHDANGCLYWVGVYTCATA